jgi:hypothetical protein
MATKNDAGRSYRGSFKENEVYDKPWVEITHLGRTVEVPQFALHTIRRFCRVLFYESDEA